MAGVIDPVTSEYDVTLNVIGGSCSESHVWSWAHYLGRIEKPIFVYYLGDHDPNGIDIERDLQDRLEGFLAKKITWQRLAINEADARREDLHGFPIRRNASRAWNRRCDAFEAEYGNRCIEVDAVPSTEIRERVERTIRQHINTRAWKQLRQVEDLERETIEKVFSNWGITP